ncbi:hypothetical protein RAC89_11010 [Paenibacillus sp. GD4]|jgi:hypothetical protein|uniref:hypothetical protein n=1 Tax=Paenibacillus sp. GD4 TaxID=3068890 RepID=UPI0027965EB1|nr:hypothetical protein [Paenibacillus sp. GD4]MDQ1910980.1 hypothetical protein [Paenibacillus sp. GD4]
MFARKIGLILSLCALSAGLVGCGARSDNGSRMQSYPQDGYLGITDVNPNHPLSPTYHHYQDDLAMIDRTARQVSGVTGVSIQADGLDARVRISVLTTDRAEAERIRAEVYQRIIENVPRYNLEVTTVTAK